MCVRMRTVPRLLTVSPSEGSLWRTRYWRLRIGFWRWCINFRITMEDSHFTVGCHLLWAFTLVQFRHTIRYPPSTLSAEPVPIGTKQVRWEFSQLVSKDETLRRLLTYTHNVNIQLFWCSVMRRVYQLLRCWHLPCDDFSRLDSHVYLWRLSDVGG